MYSQSFGFVGYYPALTAEQVGKARDEMAIVDGKNFAWKLQGVFSAYAHQQIGAPVLAVTMPHQFTAVIADALYCFYANGVWRYGVDGEWTPVFDFAGAPLFQNTKNWVLSEYKWTHAYIGTKHWFCHPSIGLFYYDEFEDRWAFFRDECWTGPVYACAAASNRLVLLLEDTVVWSKFDRGDEISCEVWQCGAGAQSLALVKYGQPYTLMPYAGGFITFTSMGTMVSRPSEDMVGDPDGKSVAVGALVYHHSALTDEHICLGPCAATHLDSSSVVWLTQLGFRAFSPTQGGGWGGVQAWQPEMSQFYAEVVVPQCDSEQALDKFCIEVARDCGWIFVSSRLPGYAYLGYERAHVFQPEVGKWGCFDNKHLMVGRARLSQIQADLGYFDHLGRLQRVDHASTENLESWVKFSPVRLQVPNDMNITPNLLTATQDFRIGVQQPGWPVAHSLSLASSWAKREPAAGAVAMPPTQCRFFVASGFSAEEANGPMKQWLHEVSRQASVVYMVGTSTGILHTFGAIAEGASNEYFCITSVEIGYTLAGVK